MDYLSVINLQCPELKAEALTPPKIKEFLRQRDIYENNIKTLSTATNKLIPRAVEKCLPSYIVDYWESANIIPDRTDTSLVTYLHEIAGKTSTTGSRLQIDEVFNQSTLETLDDDIYAPAFVRHTKFFAKVAAIVRDNDLDDLMKTEKHKKAFQKKIATAIKIPYASERIARRIEDTDKALDENDYKELFLTWITEQEEVRLAAAKGNSTSSSVPAPTTFMTNQASSLIYNKQGKLIRCRHCGKQGLHYAESCPDATELERMQHKLNHQNFLAQINSSGTSATATTTANQTYPSTTAPPTTPIHSTAKNSSTAQHPSATAQTSTAASSSAPTAPIKTRAQTGNLPPIIKRFNPSRAVTTHQGEIPAEFLGYIGIQRKEANICPDSGSAISLIDSATALSLVGAEIIIEPSEMIMADGMTKKKLIGLVTLPVMLNKDDKDPLMVQFHMVESTEKTLLLSNQVLKSLGVDVSSLVIEALAKGKNEGVSCKNITLNVNNEGEVEHNSMDAAQWLENEAVLVPTEAPADTTIPDITVLCPVYNQVDQITKELVNTFFMHAKSLLYRGDDPIICENFTLDLLDENSTFHASTRNFEPNKRDWLIAEAERLLNKKQISEAPPGMRFSSVLFPVRKGFDENGKEQFRSVIDYVAINKLIRYGEFPMPNLHTWDDKRHDSKYWAVLDAEKGYQQIQMDSKASHIMCVRILDKLYIPHRLLPGISTATGFFQRIMTKVIHDTLTNEEIAQMKYSLIEMEVDHMHIVVWLDDIKVDASTLDIFFGRMERLLFKLKKYRIKLNMKKSTFLAEEIKHCGIIYSKQGMRFDDERVQALIQTPTPTSMDSLMTFAFSANWMRTAIENFTELADPMFRELERAYTICGSRERKKVRRVALEWTESLDISFNMIRNKLIENTYLQFPNPNMELFLFTDSSDLFWSAVLMQSPRCLQREEVALEDREYKPLGFASGRFNDTESRWDTQSKETAAVLNGLDRFKYLLIDTVHIVVDHLNFISLFGNENITKNKATQNRLYRQRQTIASYRHVFHHISGKIIPFVDYFSREGAPVTRNMVNAIPFKVLAVTASIPNIHTIGSPFESHWVLPNLQDEEFIKASKNIQVNNPEVENMIQDNDGIWKTPTGRVFIPNEYLRLKCMIAAHCGLAGHVSWENMKENLLEYCTWKTMIADAKKFHLNCMHCITTNEGSKIPRPFGNVLVGSRPGEVIGIDFLDMKLDKNAEYQHLFVIVDTYSKFILLHPTKTTSAQEAVEGLVKWFSIFNPPQFITADGAKAFLSELMVSLLDTYQCNLHICSAYIHTGNSIVERSNRSILKIFRALMSELRIHTEDWIQLIPVVQLAINNFKRQRLGNHAACQVMTGIKDINQLKLMLNHNKDIQMLSMDEFKMELNKSIKDYIEAQELEQTRLIEIINQIGDDRHQSNQKQQRKKRNYHPIDIDVGDYVLVAVPESKVPTSKLLAKWRGPYQVHAVLNNFIIEVTELHNTKTSKVHISRIRKFNNMLNNTVEDLKEQFSYYADNLYVEAVIGHKKEGDDFKFLVHWLGFEDSSDSYEPARYIQEVAPDQVEVYLTTIQTKEKNTLLKFLRRSN